MEYKATEHETHYVVYCGNGQYLGPDKRPGNDTLTTLDQAWIFTTAENAHRAKQECRMVDKWDFMVKKITLKRITEVYDDGVVQ